MRRRITAWVAALALAGLAVGNADAFGRRGRGGSCGGGAGGWGGAASYGSAPYYGGGCADAGAAEAIDGYGFAGNRAAWAWKQIGPQLLLEHVGTGTLYASGADGVFRPLQPALGANAAAPAGGASRAIAADRAKRGSAVFAFDPLTGQARQVGWMAADGTLRPLAEPEGIGAPPK